MNIGAIEKIDGFQGVSEMTTLGEQQKNFGDYLIEQAQELNTKAIEADVLTEKVISGETENLHQVISAIENTKKSFELAVQVRNKLLEGYQEILRMQV